MEGSIRGSIAPPERHRSTNADVAYKLGSQEIFHEPQSVKLHDHGLFAVVDGQKNGVAIEMAKFMNHYMGSSLDRLVANILKTNKSSEHQARLINEIVNAEAQKFQEVMRKLIVRQQYRHPDAATEEMPSMAKLVQMPDKSSRLYFVKAEDGEVYVMRKDVDYLDALAKENTTNAIGNDPERIGVARYVDLKKGDRIILVNNATDRILSDERFQTRVMDMGLADATVTDHELEDKMQKEAGKFPRGDDEGGDVAFVVSTVR